MRRIEKYLYSDHWNGEHYRAISFPQFKINKKFLQENSMNGNECILDIGCGDGSTTHEIAVHVPNGHVLGIDASSSMISEAIKRRSQKNITFELKLAEEIDYNKKFDVVTMFFCIHWAQNKKFLFQKIHDALKAGGKFLMVSPLPHPHLPAIRKKIMSKDCWKYHFLNYNDPLSFINDTEYEHYANQSNFKIIKTSVKPERIYFPDYDIFFEFIYEMTPHIKQLSDDELKIKFIQELLDEYLLIYPLNTKGECVLDFNLQKLVCIR